MITRRPWLGQVPLVAHAQSSPFLIGRRFQLGSAPALTDATYSQALSAPKAIVDFWSPGCPYCVDFKPIFEELAGNPPTGVQMFTADVDQAGQSFAKYNPEMLPTVIFLANGKEIHRAAGGMTKEDFLAEVAKAFGGTAGGSAPVKGAAPTKFTPGPTTVVSSGGSNTWLAVGGLAAAGLMGWLILKQ